jgi:hypothetical protein
LTVRRHHWENEERSRKDIAKLESKVKEKKMHQNQGEGDSGKNREAGIPAVPFLFRFRLFALSCRSRFRDSRSEFRDDSLKPSHFLTFRHILSGEKCSKPLLSLGFKNKSNIDARSAFRAELRSF